MKSSSIKLSVVIHILRCNFFSLFVLKLYLREWRQQAAASPATKYISRPD